MGVGVKAFIVAAFLFVSLGGAIASGEESVPAGIDLVQFEKDLASGGVVGYVHGAVADLGLFVFTYRKAGDFFTSMEFSLVAADGAIGTQLRALQRHDRIRIHGAFLRNPSPQKHVAVTKLEMVTKATPLDVPAKPYDAKLPKDLEGKDTAEVIVHAVAADGKILVVEYKDAVLPVYASDADKTKELFRGDIIRIRYRLMRTPKGPVHVRLLADKADAPSVEVLDRLADRHEEKATIEGALVLFQKSPSISFDVYAVEVEAKSGYTRKVTLVNFDDVKVFQAIREKLAKAWLGEKPQAADVKKSIENARNCLINRRIKIRAKGILNMTSPNQANLQILLDSPDAVEIDLKDS